MNCALRDALVGAVLAACWPMAAHAQLTLGRQVTVIQTVATSAYLNGGVGLDEQAARRGFAKGFPLRMGVSEDKNSEFLAAIPLVLSHFLGKSILELHCAW